MLLLLLSLIFFSVNQLLYFRKYGNINFKKNPNTLQSNGSLCKSLSTLLIISICKFLINDQNYNSYFSNNPNKIAWFSHQLPKRICQTTPSAVGLIRCQHECNCNKGTVANICCELQFSYSLPPPFFSVCVSFCPLHLGSQHALARAAAQSLCHCRWARANWLIWAGMGFERCCMWSGSQSERWCWLLVCDWMQTPQGGVVEFVMMGLSVLVCGSKLLHDRAFCSAK